MKKRKNIWVIPGADYAARLEANKILEENGILDKDDLINFVVEIEQKKLKFNYAETKEEMKSVIKEVRILWKDLMKKRI